jgi:hypothetical protein
MQTIIGLGEAGCNIADKFSQYPQYTIYKIDVGLKKKPRHYAMKQYDHPEQYEANCPNLSRFFKGVNEDEVLFITSCGYVSAASLRILEALKRKNCKISVLYVKPDTSLLPQLKVLNENVLFGVLQEYARSGMLERIYLVDNIKLAEIMGDVPLREYYSRLNGMIVSTIHMINVYNHSTPEMSTFAESIVTARISTFGLVDFDEDKEKLFFDLDTTREKRYYYAIPEERLKTDGTLMKKITEQLKNSVENDIIKISYGVYSTNYDVPYVYCLKNSSMVQNNNLGLTKT